MSMKLISTTTLSSTADVEFTNIPQDATDLIVMISARNNSTAVADNMLISFNSSTSNFSGRRLYGIGSGSGSSDTPARYFGTSNGGTATTSTFSSTTVVIPNYAGSTAKSYSVDSVVERNATESYQYIYAGLWDNTSAITSLKITNDTSNSATGFVSGTMVSLYKVTKGSDGVTTAT